MVWGLVAAAAAQVISGVVASNSASAGRRAAANKQKLILQRIDGLQIPDIEKEKLALKEFQSAGVLTPEQEEVFTAPDSKLEQIIADPRLTQAQYGGIEALTEIAEGGGLRAEDRAKLEQAKQEAGIAARGRREASEQSLRRRGLGGSGLEVQATLEAEQAAAERLGQEAFRTGGAASERALEAILQRSKLGGDIRGQEYGEQANAAQAADRINQFNVNQRSAAERRRVDSANRAAAANLAQKQSTSDKNVNLKNQQQIHNKGLAAKNYQREKDKVALSTGAYGQAAKQDIADANQTATNISNVGSGIAKIGQAYDKKYGK